MFDYLAMPLLLA